MLYAIMGEDVPNSLERRLSVRPAHLARLEVLKNEGRLFVAGPFPAIDSNDPGPAGFSGSLIVVEFASLAEAQTWAEGDPYVDAGVYAKPATVKPFKKGAALTAMQTSDKMRELLAVLEPQAIEIIDDSALHAGHAGAREGGHYRLFIVSPQFSGKKTMERHRMVHAALATLMKDGIYALSIVSKSPDEVLTS